MRKVGDCVWPAEILEELLSIVLGGTLYLNLSICGAFLQDNIEEGTRAGHRLHVQDVLDHLHLVQVLNKHVIQIQKVQTMYSSCVRAILNPCSKDSALLLARVSRASRKGLVPSTPSTLCSTTACRQWTISTAL